MCTHYVDDLLPYEPLCMQLLGKWSSFHTTSKSIAYLPMYMYVLVECSYFLFVQVSVVTPSNHTPEPRPLARGEPGEQEASCRDCQCEVRRRGRAPGNTQLYHTHTYNESWPTTSCSSQQTPPTSPQAPPTTHSQRSSCDEDVSVERALVFEEEEERRPSIAR